jgi:drug/metabolite transporter (DMT)-like permease
MTPAGNGNSDPLMWGWLRPDVAVLFSAAMWGTMWIPARAISNGGLNSGLAAALSALVALLALLPYILRNRGVLVFTPHVWWVSFLLGFGVALYWEGMVRGNVARVVLLFYLMPVWTVILGRLINGEAATGRRLLGVALGLGGMMVVFSANGGIPLPRTLADFMGLASGFFWALALVICAKPGMERTTLSQLVGSLVMLAPSVWLLTLLPGSREAAGAVAGQAGMAATLAWLVAFGIVWVLTGMFMTLFGADHLAPGKVAIFLMLEVVIALVSSAILIDEPFGLREIAGAIMILGASLLEFTGKVGPPPDQAEGPGERNS